ncbi:hypothetical protein ACJMK2_008616 [Sinanodonta woodiana]|uniref:Secreted protein n=1 Tax=Sinanodonta woodiana TaxID=1069815 RepID=A0ABD3VME7_SINWO
MDYTLHLLGMVLLVFCQGMYTEKPFRDLFTAGNTKCRTGMECGYHNDTTNLTIGNIAAVTSANLGEKCIHGATLDPHLRIVLNLVIRRNLDKLVFQILRADFIHMFGLI